MQRILTYAGAAIIALGATLASAAPVAAATATHVAVTLAEMSVRLSVSTIPAGPVVFDITNAGAVEHEFVILKTQIPEGALPANPEEAGKATEVGHVAEVDPVLPGARVSLSATLGPGTYLLICNKVGHYTAGMYATLTVATPVGVTLKEMSITPTQNFAIAGPVTFQIKNAGAVMHELVVLKTDIAEGSIPARTEDPSKAQEPGAVGEAEDIAPGATATLTLSLAPGKYVLICNEPGHYAAGMHTSFTVLPTVSRFVSAAIDAALAARGIEDLKDEEAMVNVGALLKAPGVVVTATDRAAIASGIIPRVITADGSLLY